MDLKFGANLVYFFLITISHYQLLVNELLSDFYSTILKDYLRAMKQSAIRWTLILGVITIIGVSVVQFFFLRQALNQEDKRLDQTIQIALNGVSEQLARYNDADLPYENPVVRLRPDYYVVNVNGFIDGDILEYYLTAELRKRKLNLDFEYGIYDCQTDEMVYGNYISLSDKSGNPSEAPD